MTKKIFYQFVLKTVGLFTLKELIESILQMFSIFFYDYTMKGSLFITILSILILLVCKAGLIYACLFKTDKIIELLKLADDDTVLTDWYFDLNMLLSLAIIIIGLLMIVYSLPMLIFQLIEYIKLDQGSRFQLFDSFSEKASYIVPLIKLLIGFLLISNYKLLIKWIYKTSELIEPPEKIE